MAKVMQTDGKSRLASANPIWSEGPAYAPETMTKPTATMLARRIEAYWAKLGHDVKCHVVPFDGDLTNRCSMYAVRSNLINGAPR